MKKTVCVCDLCGAEFNPINGYSDLELNDLDFVKKLIYVPIVLMNFVML